jgi:hypothetical protein
MDLEHVRLIATAEFENERLLEVKKQRTVTEYSWTCTSSLCWYMLGKVETGELITYLDADMFFFFDPEIIFAEIGDSSVGIIEHRLEGIRKKLEKYVGKYNVGWVTFRKDQVGANACEWWKDKVLEWCFSRFEGGKIGDQHYLNNWTEIFKGVCVIRHLGADVAPWNVNNRKISAKDGIVFIGEMPLVFYHFHSFTLVSNDFYLPAPAYHIPSTAKRHIYRPYFNEIRQAIAMVAVIDPAFNYGYKKKYLKSLLASIFFNNQLTYYFYINYSCYNLEKTYA